jgi:hypothetical protein
LPRKSTRGDWSDNLFARCCGALATGRKSRLKNNLSFRWMARNIGGTLCESMKTHSHARCASTRRRGFVPSRRPCRAELPSMGNCWFEPEEYFVHPSCGEPLKRQARVGRLF